MGDTLVVKLSIVAPTDLYYVLVESPLPAGTEAVDTSLKTTSQIAEGPDFNPVESTVFVLWRLGLVVVHAHRTAR